MRRQSLNVQECGISNYLKTFTPKSINSGKRPRPRSLEISYFLKAWSDTAPQIHISFFFTVKTNRVSFFLLDRGNTLLMMLLFHVITQSLEEDFFIVQFCVHPHDEDIPSETERKASRRKLFLQQPFECSLFTDWLLFFWYPQGLFHETETRINKSFINDFLRVDLLVHELSDSNTISCLFTRLVRFLANSTFFVEITKRYSGSWCRFSPSQSERNAILISDWKPLESPFMFNSLLI